MSAPASAEVQLYLIALDADGRLTTTTCREVLRLKHLFRQQYEACKNLSSLIFAGVWHPDRALLSDLLTRFSGLTLVSESACLVMPLQELRTCDVGRLPATALTPAMALRAVISGWGVDTPMTTIAAARRNNEHRRFGMGALPTEASAQLPALCDDWVDATRYVAPHAHAALTYYDIFTDSDFAAHKALLSPDARDAIESVRAKSLLQRIDPTDLYQVLAIAPCRLLAKPVRSILLSARTVAALAKSGVQRLGDLLRVGPEALSSQTGPTRRSLPVLAEKLAAAIRRDVPEELGRRDDWLLELQRGRPSLWQLVARAGISSDARFHAAAASLDADTAAALYRFRWKSLSRDIDASDPAEIVKILPPELLRLPVAILGLAGQAASFARREGIVHVGRLGAFNRRLLGTDYKLGPGAIDDLLHGLVRLQNEFVERLQRQLTPPTLRQLLHQGILALGDRQRQVIRQRLGFLGQKSTLRELADELRVTPERIRQLAQAAIRTIDTQHQIRELLVSHLRNYCASRPGRKSAFLSELPVQDPWFDGFESELGLLCQIIRCFAEGQASIASREGKTIVTAKAP